MKNINPRTIGLIIEPNKKPNRIHNLLKGYNISDFKIVIKVSRADKLAKIYAKNY